MLRRFLSLSPSRSLQPQVVPFFIVFSICGKYLNSCSINSCSIHIRATCNAGPYFVALVCHHGWSNSSDFYWILRIFFIYWAFLDNVSIMQLPASQATCAVWILPYCVAIADFPIGKLSDRRTWKNSLVRFLLYLIAAYQPSIHSYSYANCQYSQLLFPISDLECNHLLTYNVHTHSCCIFSYPPPLSFPTYLPPFLSYDFMPRFHRHIMHSASTLLVEKTSNSRELQNEKCTFLRFAFIFLRGK